MQVQEYLNTLYPKSKRKDITSIWLKKENMTGELDLSDFPNLERLHVDFHNSLVSFSFDSLRNTTNIESIVFINGVVANTKGLEHLPLNNLKELVCPTVEYKKELKPFDYSVRDWKLVNHPHLMKINTLDKMIEELDKMIEKTDNHIEEIENTENRFNGYRYPKWGLCRRDNRWEWRNAEPQLKRLKVKVKMLMNKKIEAMAQIISELRKEIKTNQGIEEKSEVEESFKVNLTDVKASPAVIKVNPAIEVATKRKLEMPCSYPKN